MHRPRLLLALIAWTALSSAVFAQQVDVYFRGDSLIDAPDISIDKDSCPRSAPCRFGGSSNPWHRYYPGLSIKATFIAGSPTYVQESHFGCSGDLTLEFEAHNMLQWLQPLYFGNDTHRVNTLTIIDSQIFSQHTIYAYASNSIHITTSKITLLSTSLPKAMHMDLLPGGRVLFEEVDFKMGSAFNGLYINSTSTLQSVMIVNSQFYDFSVEFMKVEAPKIENLFFSQNSFDGPNLPYFVTTPNMAPKLLVDSFHLEECDLNAISDDFTENLQIRAHYAHVESLYLDNRQFLFEGTNDTDSTFEFYFNEIHGDGINGRVIFVDLFEHVEFVGNYFEYSTMQVSDTFPAKTFESQSDMFIISYPNTIFASSSAWFDDLYSENSNFLVGGSSDGSLTPEAYFTYCSMLRDTNRVSTSVKAVEFYVYESFWLPLEAVSARFLLPMVTIFGSSSTTTQVHGNGIIDSLQWTCMSGCNFANHAELHVTGSMNGQSPNGAINIYNGGILAFHADPVTCEPTKILSLAILASLEPDTNSVISAYVWKAGDSCAAIYISSNVALDPSEHLLEVVIENGDIDDPVDGSVPIQLVMLLDEGSNPNYLVNNSWAAVYPTTEYPFDPVYNFTGTAELMYSPSESYFVYSVTSFFCTGACHGNGNCVGVDTCSCHPTYSGYTCGCRNLPADVYCSADEEDLWLTPSDLIVGDSASFTFPDDVGGSINGSLTNGGTLYLKDARYDIAGAFKNDGEVKIVSSVSQIRNGTSINGQDNGCLFVPTSRSFAKDISLLSGSTLNVELDLASASTSKCPSTSIPVNPPFPTPSSGAPMTKRESYGVKAAIYSKRSAQFSGSSSKSLSSSASSNSKSSKSRALLESESSNTANGTMKVTITKPPTEAVQLTLFASRNATDSKVTTMLSVIVTAPEGTCTSILQKPNLVTLFASPCSNNPGLAPNKKQNLKWYYYGAPIIAVAALLVVLIVIFFTVPTVRRKVSPYSGSRT